MTKALTGDFRLKNWDELNKQLKLIDTVKECQRLLEIEQGGRRRQEFIFRIHSRLNRLRRRDERQKLLTKAGREFKTR